MATKCPRPARGPKRPRPTNVPAKTPTKVKPPSAPAVATTSPPIKRFESIANGEAADHVGTDSRLLVSQSEAREMLGIGRSTMAALVGTGTIKSVLIKRRRLIPVGELKRVARQGCV